MPQAPLPTTEASTSKQPCPGFTNINRSHGGGGRGGGDRGEPFGLLAGGGLFHGHIAWQQLAVGWIGLHSPKTAIPPMAVANNSCDRAAFETLDAGWQFMCLCEGVPCGCISTGSGVVLVAFCHE
jgi:hypothetical protein